jgi:hypothetical protein
MAHGPYDEATECLNTMHNPRVPMWRRIDIAKFLIETHPEEFRTRWVQDPDAPTITIVIGGISAEQHPPRLAAPDQDHVADNHSPARLN